MDESKDTKVTDPPAEPTIDFDEHHLARYEGTLAEANEEHTISAAIDWSGAVSLVEALQQMEGAAAIFERRIALLTTCRKAAIRATQPQDWIINRDREGNENAMLKSSGAQTIAQYYGIQVRNIRPTGPQGEFRPEETVNSEGVTLRAWCDARSNVTGREVHNLEASRSSTEDFIGRGESVGASTLVQRSDLRAATYTLLQTKAVRVLAAMSRVPRDELEQAWEGTGKSASNCVKGSGYGTAKDRNARGVSDDCDHLKELLRREILSRTGGDTGAARQLLVELTANPDKGFKGFDSIDRLTRTWQCDNAIERLEKHPVFGGKVDRTTGGEEGADATDN